ncbi:cyclic nucleotide-binding domain-containing protein [Actinomadura viridis]|uniref:cyclic nucleotide-binding domain-containing protein n=1 Tax=Actinomadura viridis TaxID=58110 RepID=UPI003673BC33
MILGPARRHDPDHMGRTPRRPADTACPPNTSCPPNAVRARAHARHRPAQAHLPVLAPRPPAPVRGFLPSLTREERHALAEAATTVVYPAGAVFWQEEQNADHVVVILSGQVRVSVARAGQERVIATRGPGDIVGERAAFLLRRRSATVVALETVRTLRLTTREFGAYLARHPRTVAVLEKEMYARMTEGEAPPGDGAPPLGTAPPALVTRPSGPPLPRWREGRTCTIVFTDIAEFSAPYRTDDDRLTIRRVMYELLREAFGGSEVPWDGCYREDRGDGALIIVPSEPAARAVADPILARLAAGLRRHNGRSCKAVRIQLRLALHVGPVTHDDEGVAGSAVIHTARLLDAPPFKEWLAMTSSDLGFIASTPVYESVIATGPGHAVPGGFRRVRCTVKESDLTAWMRLSGVSVPPAAA